MSSFEYIISEEHLGERLDSFLTAQKEIGLTRSQVKKLINDGYVKVNNKAPRSSHKIKPDDRIIVRIPPPKKLEVTPENIPLNIVYEDDDLVVVNKARGMVVHPAAGNYSGTLVNALLCHCCDLSGIGGVLRPGIVHRLDKDTSGLIVVAKNDIAHHALTKQFKDRKIFKQYLALVHGEVRQKEGDIHTLLGRNPKNRKKMAVIHGVRGREAFTHYKVLERFKDYTLLEVEIKTGRTHQIRVHLTSIGHAVVGDPAYGHCKEEFEVKGQLLHAAKLGFVHPRSNKHLEFTADLPEDIRDIVKKLRMKQECQEQKAGR